MEGKKLYNCTAYLEKGWETKLIEVITNDGLSLELPYLDGECESYALFVLRKIEPIGTSDATKLIKRYHTLFGACI